MNVAVSLLNELLPKYLGLLDVVVADKEYVYHSFWLGILTCINLDIASNKEMWNKFYDISFEVTNT